MSETLTQELPIVPEHPTFDELMEADLNYDRACFGKTVYGLTTSEGAVQVAKEYYYKVRNNYWNDLVS